MSFEKWKTGKLKDVIDVFIDYRGKTPTKSEAGIPLITAKVVKNGRIEEPNEFIPEADFENWMTRGLPEIGDVVLTTEAPLGEVAQINFTGKVALAQRIITMRGKKGVLDNSFLKYTFQTARMQERLSGRATGTTVTGIKSSELREVEIDFPDFETQRRIAALLTALDDKIELNRRMNETLEGLAQAVWGEWFGGYLGGEGLPKGWQWGVLEDVIGELETGGRPKGGVKEILEGIPSIGAESITRIGQFDYSKTRFVPVAFFQSMRKGLIKHKDILVYKDGGKPGNFIPHIGMFGNGFPFDVCAINEHVYRLQANEPFLQNYLYLWLNSDFAIEEMKIKGTGVAIPGLNSTALKSIGVLIPDASTMKKFDAIIEPMFLRIFENSKQSRTLTVLRDALLPRLMGGEI